MMFERGHAIVLCFDLCRQPATGRRGDANQIHSASDVHQTLYGHRRRGSVAGIAWSDCLHTGYSTQTPSAEEWFARFVKIGTQVDMATSVPIVLLNKMREAIHP